MAIQVTLLQRKEFEPRLVRLPAVLEPGSRPLNEARILGDGITGQIPVDGKHHVLAILENGRKIIPMAALRSSPDGTDYFFLNPLAKEEEVEIVKKGHRLVLRQTDTLRLPR